MVTLEDQLVWVAAWVTTTHVHLSHYERVAFSVVYLWGVRVELAVSVQLQLNDQLNIEASDIIQEYLTDA